MEKEIQHFFDFANQFVPLVPEDITDLLSHLQLLEYDKKELILEQGDKCLGVYFVIDGLIRLFQINEGNDRSCGFMEADDFHTDYESIIFKKECTYYIETIEPTRLFYLPYNKLLNAYDNSHKLERFGRLMTERALETVLKNTNDIANLKAEEKYTNFEKENKSLVNRIPLKHLASYIGITPESLSRIRKKRVKSIF